MEFFEILNDLAQLGIRIIFEEDWGNNTFSVGLVSKEELFDYIDLDGKKLASGRTHFHSGYPGCNAQEGYSNLLHCLNTLLQDSIEKLLV